MKACRFRKKDGAVRLGLFSDDHVIDAGPAGPAGFIPTEAAWAELKASSGQRLSLDEVELLPPITPGKIIGVGLNYHNHAEESELDVPDVPVIFSKFPSSLVGGGHDIVIPREETRPDFEGELAVVIGRRTYRVAEADALSAVGGVSIINDVSGRRAQLETPLRQFTLGKSFDTFSPMGPCICSLDGLDIGHLDLQTVVSGEVMQRACTKDLIFSVAQLIAYCSRGMTLHPGDVIATGTPGGVGDSRKPPRYLREGDVVEVEISGIGTLRNKVVRETA